MNLLPSVPTDNLYKFMALSGLAVLALSFSLPLLKIFEIERASIAIDSELKRLEKETEWYQADGVKVRERLKARQKELIFEHERVAGPKQQQVSELKKLLELNQQLGKEIDAAEDQFTEKVRAADRKSIEISEKIALNKQLIRESKVYGIGMFIGFFVGSLLTVFGFRLWYSRVQRALDVDSLKKSASSDTSVRFLRKSAAGKK